MRNQFTEHRLPGKVCGRNVIETMKKVTKCRIREEQCGFKKGKGYVDHLFKLVAKRYIVKRRKLHATFMDVEKVCDQVN